MVRNPRPCQRCGLPESWHPWMKGEGEDRCLYYRRTERKAPLRAKRRWAPSDGRIEIHVHVPGPVTELTKARLIQMLSEIRDEALV